MKSLENKIFLNENKIIDLLNENIDLKYDLELSKFNKFSEQLKNIGTKNNPEYVKIKIGHWFEYSKDESRPNEKGIKIERIKIIEVDGHKSNGWQKIKYYKKVK